MGSSFSLVIFASIKKFTPERGIIHVSILEKPSVTPVVITDMESVTPERSLMLLSIVEKLSGTLITADMKCFTLVSSLMLGSFWKSLP